MAKPFNLGSSPTKDIEQMFDDQNIAEVGWTPYIDKIFGTTTPGPGGPSASFSAVTPGSQARLSAANPYKMSPSSRKKQKPNLTADSYGAKLFSSPRWDPSWNTTTSVQQGHSMESFSTTLKTPNPDKSFRVSDYLFESPGDVTQPPGHIQQQLMQQQQQLQQQLQMQMQMNQPTQAPPPEKENDPLMIGLFSTPSANKTLRFLKTPGSSKFPGLLPSALSNTPLLTMPYQAVSAEPAVDIPAAFSPYKTPLKNQQRTALANIDPNIEPNTSNLDSSPSTILLTSTIKKESKQPAALENSPTPATKSHLKQPPCRLVRSTSAMEPALGLFHDGAPKPQLPPLAHFTNSLNPRKRTADQAQQPQQPPLQTQGPGQGKFQIIFADMKTLQASYTNRDAKRARKSNAKGKRSQKKH